MGEINMEYVLELLKRHESMSYDEYSILLEAKDQDVMKMAQTCKEQEETANEHIKDIEKRFNSLIEEYGKVCKQRDVLIDTLEKIM